MKTSHAFLHFPLLALLAVAASAPPDAAETAAKPPACASEAHRQFDFWVGTWRVSANGKVAGENRIEKILGGCALLESWAGAGGHRGHSLNFYDEARGEWHQTWIDGAGEPLHLDGRFADGRMRLEGRRPDPKSGGETRHRITWTPAADGTLRQLWETSSDGRKWTVVFDGRYERSDGAAGSEPRARSSG